MKVIVRSPFLASDIHISLPSTPTPTVAILKKAIKTSSDLQPPVSHQQLLYGGRYLNDDTLELEKVKSEAEHINGTDEVTPTNIEDPFVFHLVLRAGWEKKKRQVEEKKRARLLENMKENDDVVMEDVTMNRVIVQEDKSNVVQVDVTPTPAPEESLREPPAPQPQVLPLPPLPPSSSSTSLLLPSDAEVLPDDEGVSDTPDANDRLRLARTLLDAPTSSGSASLNLSSTTERGKMPAQESSFNSTGQRVPEIRYTRSGSNPNLVHAPGMPPVMPPQYFGGPMQQETQVGQYYAQYMQYLQACQQYWMAQHYYSLAATDPAVLIHRHRPANPTPSSLPVPHSHTHSHTPHNHTQSNHSTSTSFLPSRAFGSRSRMEDWRNFSPAQSQLSQQAATAPSSSHSSTSAQSHSHSHPHTHAHSTTTAHPAATATATQPAQPQAAAQPNPVHRRRFRLIVLPFPRFLSIFSVLLKLSFFIYIFTRDTDWYRSVFMYAVCAVIFLTELGVFRWRRRRRDREDQEREGRENQPEPAGQNANAGQEAAQAPAAGAGGAANAAQVPAAAARPTAEAADPPVRPANPRLLPEVQAVFMSFFTSLIPGAVNEDHAQAAAAAGNDEQIVDGMM